MPRAVTTLGSGCLTDCCSHVDSVRCVSHDVVLGAYRFHLRLPAHANNPGAVRHHVGCDYLRCDAVCRHGHRSSASDQLDRTDWPPDDRRCNGSTVFRKKHPVHDSVGTGRNDGCCLVALHFYPSSGGRSATVDPCGRMGCGTNRPDRRVVGICYPSTRRATYASPHRRWHWSWESVLPQSPSGHG